jgi:hypothetical protein
MYTSVLLVALAGGNVAPAEASPKVSWEASYTTASLKGSRLNKPLAVFVGRGAQGWKDVSSEGKLSPTAIALLNKSYVCVYVDMSKPDGRKLARDLELDGTGGLVLSTRDGASQAFSHPGDMAPRDLVRTLKKFASPSYVPTRTESLGSTTTRYSYVPPSRPAPAASFPSHFRAPAFPSFGGGRAGGC